MEKMFLWKDEFETKNKTIDDQHKKIFELANKSFTVSYKKGNRILMELYKYTNYHFREEEAYMKEINYSDIKKHKKLHLELITKLNKVSEKGINSENELSQLQSLLWFWLKNHIMEEDKKIKN